MILEVKNFLPNTGDVRAHALASNWGNLVAFDGEVYGRVCQTVVPGLREALEAAVGPLFMLGEGYRLNYENETPNHAIHVDGGWGTHAVVVYLSETPSLQGKTGTAFWTYKGQDDPEDHTDNPEEWTLDYLCHEEFGKCVIYTSDQYHSRWPLEAYGTDAESGRLIAVAFFNPLNEDLTNG